MKRSSHRAFTLVEILVVLAIVGILATLLLGVFSRVRQNAQKTSCANNLRQLATAMQLYLQDNASAFPLETTTTTKNGVSTWIQWSDRLENSASIQSVIHCPSRTDMVRMTPSEPDYMLGRDVSSEARPGGIGPHRLLAVHFESQVAAPAETELFIERNVLDSQVPLTGRAIKSRSCGEQIIFNLHLDGANIAYVDGHVKWMSADAQALRDEVCGW